MQFHKQLIRKKTLLIINVGRRTFDVYGERHDNVKNRKQYDQSLPLRV